MNTYLAIYKGDKKEVQSDASYEAQKLAAGLFKTKKSYDVTVMLLAIDNKSVIHSTVSI